jgi:hypothetical protein
MSDDLETIGQLRELLDRSVRIEPADFDGEAGCRFIVGEDHVVAEWRGDGIASDRVFAETPELEYLVTTTPHDRCCRMVLELVHWEVVAALLRGPGDGKLCPMSERLDDDAELVAIAELTAVDEVLGNGADEQLWPPGLTRGEAVARLVQDAAREENWAKEVEEQRRLRLMVERSSTKLVDENRRLERELAASQELAKVSSQAVLAALPVVAEKALETVDEIEDQLLGRQSEAETERAQWKELAERLCDEKNIGLALAGFFRWCGG